MTGPVAIKRVYDPPSEDDGMRILVDRLWPRGISKEKGRIDRWMKAVAPSDALRKQIHADPDHATSLESWSGFVAAYGRELADGEAADAAQELIELIQGGPVTLLYAAKGEERNNASALRDWLLPRLD